ncbi:ATP-binding protein [Campylobacter sp. 9BO]|uniref:ATP-binding protein n=1 Tax=Campylobacter sp. 9BO TaxID=3424759 RepID=UPI003D3555D1
MQSYALILACFIIVFLLFKSRKSELEIALSKTPNLALLLTDKHNHIKFINKKFESIFGLKSKEFIGKSLNDLLKRLKFSELNELFMLHAKEQNSCEVVIKNGENYLRFSLSNVLKNAIKFEGYILSVADITHEKELELAKVKNEQMLLLNSKMAILGEMVSAISHQQRSPLSSLMLCLDEIDELAMSGQTSGIDLQVNRAKQSIHLINETIGSFSKFYKNDDSVRDVDVSQIIVELVLIIKPKLNEHGIKLVCICDKTQKFITKSVSSYIKQILLSLISNAKDELVKFASQNFEAIPEITINLEQIADEICISISDNGTGIDDASRIFEPFFTNKENGTGMGLYVAYELSKKLNARLSLQSAKAPTKFCLFLKNRKIIF